MSTTAIYNTSDEGAHYRPRNTHLRELDVAFAQMMERDIRERHGVDSPEHRAALSALDIAREEVVRG